MSSEKTDNDVVFVYKDLSISRNMYNFLKSLYPNGRDFNDIIESTSKAYSLDKDKAKEIIKNQTSPYFGNGIIGYIYIEYEDKTRDIDKIILTDTGKDIVWRIMEKDRKNDDIHSQLTYFTTVKRWKEMGDPIAIKKYHDFLFDVIKNDIDIYSRAITPVSEEDIIKHVSLIRGIDYKKNRDAVININKSVSYGLTLKILMKKTVVIGDGEQLDLIYVHPSYRDEVSLILHGISKSTSIDKVYERNGFSGRLPKKTDIIDKRNIKTYVCLLMSYLFSFLFVFIKYGTYNIIFAFTGFFIPIYIMFYIIINYVIKKINANRKS